MSAFKFVYLYISGKLLCVIFSSTDNVAKWLIEENFISTALEFYVELAEFCREVKRLRAYFSNPAHFELQAATLLRKQQKT